MRLHSSTQLHMPNSHLHQCNLLQWEQMAEQSTYYRQPDPILPWDTQVSNLHGIQCSVEDGWSSPQSISPLLGGGSDLCHQNHGHKSKQRDWAHPAWGWRL